MGFASDRLKDNKDFIFKTVKSIGLVLEFSSARL
jgi:hypothetical protein